MSLENHNQNKGESVGEGQEENELMVEVVRISTLFPDQKLLEKIADDLLSKGVISGFTIEPVRSGYTYQGEQVTENQFALEILLDSDDSSGISEQVRQKIEAAIGEKWDVPIIKEETVRVNKEVLGFIRRAEVEHERFIQERKKKHTFIAAAFVSVAALLGVFIEQYADSKAEKAIAIERRESLERLRQLRGQTAEIARNLETQIQSGEELTEGYTDMAVSGGYEEIQAFEDIVEETERELSNLLKDE